MKLPQTYIGTCWALVVVAAVLAGSMALTASGLATQEPVRADQAEATNDAQYDAHVAKLKTMMKKEFPDVDFQVLVERPFVVIGDESLARIKSRAKHTIRWAVERLKKDYFKKDPDHIINIWLFKDKTSYEKHVEQLFGSKPTTPYGYYSYRNRALVMNISTGGGTLVHEIVHPFIAANFEDCPCWFNEGLASLYEQCRDQDGHIRGSTNWRLAGLQRTIKAGTLPMFKELCHTNRHEFYQGTDRDTNYSQARYLCYYLQEQGLLVDYYHKFRAAADTDPSGYKTLVDVLDKPEMKTFQASWEKYVSELRYP